MFVQGLHYIVVFVEASMMVHLERLYVAYDSRTNLCQNKEKQKEPRIFNEFKMRRICFLK